MNNEGLLKNIDIESIEELYQKYLVDSDSIDESWRYFFQGFEFKKYGENSNQGGCTELDNEFKILNLIQGYRQRGHLFTRTNPVRTRRTYSPTLAIENFGLNESDLDNHFNAGKEIGLGRTSLRSIVSHLQETYCESVGVEYLYIRTPEVVKWLQTRMEESSNQQKFSIENRKHIFHHLKQAVGFESFIHRKFVGQKRFSLEGTETLIPALDAVIERGAELGIDEFVIGMAHRGRLNVLANIIQKPYENIFREYVGKDYNNDVALGDVKYHLGFESDIITDTGKPVRLSLLPNPSHLEAVTPVVTGMARSRIDSVYKGNFKKLAPIIIHGDAAIAVQGVVYEVVQMSQLKGYKTGGTIHLVVNNQVGFTTNYLDGRSSTYCTDIAKVTRSPVFHVNGDDVEALIYSIKLAMEFRQTFNSDVFIDILSYRKHGHNEGDEPRFTQPILYEAISKHPNPRDIYSEKLIAAGVMQREEIANEIDTFDHFLEEKLSIAQQSSTVKISNFLVKEYEKIEAHKPGDLSKPVKTAVAKDKLIAIAERINNLPRDKQFFQKAVKIIEDRKAMIEKNSLDWAMCELLAYGTLVAEGHPVRLSGQDSERGTFAHRHAMLVEEDMAKKYFQLKYVAHDQAPFHVYNSHLSEYGVLGFEYGYALAQPNGLTIWEAQFGDFSNVAQVIIDQYITSASEKWGIHNGLVLYLPHGYEGQGPEHSSARIERFIAAATNSNMLIMNITSPANLFHALRRQIHWKYRLPMIIFTPKSMLRHPLAVSTLEELSEGSFKEVIDDVNAEVSKIKTLVFTSGKLFYQLNQERTEKKYDHVALVRLEQLYPLPIETMKELIAKYSFATRFAWAQDEPENMGMASFMSLKFNDPKLEIIARPESASPAGGLMAQHNQRQQQIVDKVFELNKVKR